MDNTYVDDMGRLRSFESGNPVPRTAAEKLFNQLKKTDTKRQKPSNHSSRKTTNHKSTSSDHDAFDASMHGFV